MIAYHNIQAFVLTLVPLGIALILFFTRISSVVKTKEKVKTYDMVLMSFFGIALFTALSSIFEVLRLSVSTRLTFVILIDVCTCAFSYYFFEYALETMLDGKDTRKLAAFSKLLLVASLLLLAWTIPTGRSFYFDANGYYYRGDLFLLNAIYPAAVTVMSVAIAFHADTTKRLRISFSSYSIIIILALALQNKHAELSMTGLGISAVMLILYGNVFAERSIDYFKLKSQLTEEELLRMQNQMKPHFMYNTLSSIQELCIESPEEAEYAIGEFTKFIRVNMDYMTQREPVSILKEIEFTRNYVNLEKIRFGERLEAEFDIEETYFMIPALTVQPIVENAIRYGILSRLEGGKVKISTKKINDEFHVIVEDNGIGFNKIESAEARSHIGLNNLRKRIELGCGGRVLFETEDNVGTKVTIILPSKMIKVGDNRK